MNNIWWVQAADLNDDQKHAVQLEADGRYLVTGPPGSGKTNILLLRAKYLQKLRRPNYQVLLFTRTLREFVSLGTGKYEIDDGKVSTLMAWGREFLRQAGRKVDLRGLRHDEARARLMAEIRDLVNTHDYSALYDTILLDEAQDYTADEVEVFARMAENLFIVADSRQQIYEDEDPLDRIRKLVSEEVVLRHHYRNGIAICRVADRMGIPDLSMERTSNYDEKKYRSSAEHFVVGSIEEACGIAVAKLERQLLAYPEELLGVVCPLKADLAKVEEILAKSSIGKYLTVQKTDEYQQFEDGRPICLCTAHSAKGLEFRALHIIEAQGVQRFRSRARRLMFTSVTRAKTSLSVYTRGSLHGWLEHSLSEPTPGASRPTLDDLFPEGSE